MGCSYLFVTTLPHSSVALIAEQLGETAAVVAAPARLEEDHSEDHGAFACLQEEKDDAKPLLRLFA